MVPLLLAMQLVQSPSPMVEHTRLHRRQERRDTPGERLPARFGTILLPPGAADRPVPLVVHFHGAPWLVEQSVRRAKPRGAVLAVQIGAGSRVYAEPFQKPGSLAALIDVPGRRWGAIWLTAFSAGYGAVREILRDPASQERIEGVVLLDGLHSGYETPEEKRQPRSEDLEPFLAFARLAAAGRKRMLVTHSEIFPGSYASTTECADFLLDRLGLKRRAVARWGPSGMQMLSDTRRGRLRILGFAGNSAPDHVDHLHALDWALRRMP